MKQETIHDFFVEQVQDLYDAERQLVKALPKMADAAHAKSLIDAIRSHFKETENHVARLEEIFRILDLPAKPRTCKAMKGLIEEGEDGLKEQEGEVRDLAIIAAAQRVEHYEISAYGTARALAERLAITDAVGLLRQTEDEEATADRKLTDVANTIYNGSEELDTAAAGGSRALRL